MKLVDGGVTNGIFESASIREEMGEMPLARTRRVPDHAVIAQRACEWAETKRELARWAEHPAQHCVYLETNPHKRSCRALGVLLAPDVCPPCARATYALQSAEKRLLEACGVKS